MYAAGYPSPDALRTMDPRLKSHMLDSTYRLPHHSWGAPIPLPYPDFGATAASAEGHVPSPLPSSLNPSGGSPDAHFDFSVDKLSFSLLPQQEQEHWAMSVHTAQRGSYIDGNYTPQVKVESSHAPLDAVHNTEQNYIQDTSYTDPYVQSLPANDNEHAIGVNGSIGPDRTRPRAARQAAATKRTGACARCRRLKMKCTFANPQESDICLRCNTGKFECVFPGRKPRAPGMRMVLRQQIREKDAMIDNLLSRVNPGPTMATPLTLASARLPLSSRQRAEYRDILAYLERSAQQQRVLDGRARFDISALEDILGSDEDTDSEDEVVGNTTTEDGNGGSSSPKRSGSVEHTQPVDTVLEFMAPTGIMAAAALHSNRAAANAKQDSGSDSSGTSHGSKGVAGDEYFLPGPQANLELRRLIVERQAAPDILLSGLVTSEDVTALFEIHFKWINPIIPILDENIHSPASVLARCPFLFTVICTVASRYYKAKPQIYDMAIHFAKAAAANTVIDGWKTVEMCQAFALWSVYNPPARRWEEDRAWCYTGIAFRLATELNLSRIPDKFADERQERESHNRTRMWLMCFIMDRCLSIQSGKAWMVQEDATIRDAASWLNNHKYHCQCDPYLVTLTELLITMSRFVGTVNPAFGRSSIESLDDIDFAALYKVYDDELLARKAVCDERHAGEKSSKDPATVMQITLINCVYYYCRLVICCCGLQLMSRRKTMKPNELLAGCVQAATSLVKLMVEDFVPSGFVPYFPELVYVHSAFASVVLLKCLRPEYNAYLDLQQEERIIGLIQSLFDVWTSDQLSVDERHNTQLYAHFLKQLMEPHIARVAERKRREAQGSGCTPSTEATSPPTSASAPTPTYSDVGSSHTEPKEEHPPAMSPVPGPSTLHHDPTAAFDFGDPYATDVDISKTAAQLASTGMIPQGMADMSWEELMTSGAMGMGNGMVDSLGGLMGQMMNGTTPMGATDWNGMAGNDSLAAMMGLADSAWFMTAHS